MSNLLPVQGIYQKATCLVLVTAELIRCYCDFKAYKYYYQPTMKLPVNSVYQLRRPQIRRRCTNNACAVCTYHRAAQFLSSERSHSVPLTHSPLPLLRRVKICWASAFRRLAIRQRKTPCIHTRSQRAKQQILKRNENLVSKQQSPYNSA